jgi:hypothetical protein
MSGHESLLGHSSIDVDTLAERLKHEPMSQDAVLVVPPLTGVWTRC